MKRITLTVAVLLFGGVYMANAQVGIGTATPSASAQLDIVSTDTGVLIPRVELNKTSEFGPIKGAAVGVQSLLVYNTKVVEDVVKGFYYWENAKWNKIINQTDLDEAIIRFGGDVTKIKELIKYIVPTSPVNNPAGADTHTTIVYDPTTKTISYVSYAGGAYTKTPVDFSAIVAAAETKTFVKKVVAPVGGRTKYYYFSEETIQTYLAANPTQTIADITEAAPGVITIDVSGDIINNFEELLQQTTNYGGDTVTIENIIKTLAEQTDGNVVYKNIAVLPAVQMGFQYWDAATETYINILLSDFETKTRIIKTPVVGTKIVYSYANEGNKPDVNGIRTVGNADLIEITADMVTSINTDIDVQNAIKKMLNAGGNVYYTGTAIDAADNAGTAIPAGSLFTVDAAGKKIVIDISGAVINAITNNATEVKTILGNKYNVANHFKTGDTWTNGKPIYAFKGSTNIIVNSAVASTVTLPVSADNIVSIKLYKSGNLVTSSVTDVALVAAALNFNIGTGNMYNILPVGTYEVIVEFTPTVVPAP